MEYQIRAVCLADLDKAAALEGVCFPIKEAAPRAVLAQRIVTFPESFLVAEKDGELIGMIHGGATDQWAITDDLYHDVTLHRPDGAYQAIFGLDTAPEFRRQGVAADLLHHMIAAAQQAGRIGVILTCKVQLVAYYASFGFVSMGVSQSKHGGAEWYDMLLCLPPKEAFAPAVFGSGGVCQSFLAAIDAVYAGKRTLWKTFAEYKWLQYLWATKENDFNCARTAKLGAVSGHNTLSYVRHTLLHLRHIAASFTPEQADTAAVVLAWAETAKGGMPKERMAWENAGISLIDHASGSAALYLSTFRPRGSFGEPHQEIAALLIRMHGAMGQYMQGEIAPDKNTLPFTSAHGMKSIQTTCADIGYSYASFCKCLELVSECVLAGVSDKVAADGAVLLAAIGCGEKLPYYDEQERMRRLCGCQECWTAQLTEKAAALLRGVDLWYADGTFKALQLQKAVRFLNAMAESAALSHLISAGKDEEQTSAACPVISLKNIQDKLYFYSDKKRYTDYCMLAMLERAIEHGRLEDTEHVRFAFVFSPDRMEIGVQAEFTDTGSAIDAFYHALVVSDITHNRAVLAVFDQFGYRSDIFDRVGNEDKYLSHMNSAADDKRRLLPFIKDGQRVLDVGPGGGVFLELIGAAYPRCRLAGADISTEVCKRLRQKIEAMGYGWDVLHSDFLDLREETAGKFDVIVFCSIIHEIFSYGAFEGHRFNKAVIPEILKVAAGLLKEGGRIVIRDGVASETNDEVTIRFLDQDLECLAQDYIHKFQGFDLAAQTPAQTGQVHVYRMPYNSMMEVLYTVTWGKDSLPFEVEEWYGYYSAADWRALEKNLCPYGLRMIYYTQYLQSGYAVHLENKVELKNSMGELITFPDSNAVVVFEKSHKPESGGRI